MWTVIGIAVVLAFVWVKLDLDQNRVIAWCGFALWSAIILAIAVAISAAAAWVVFQIAKPS